MDTPTSSQQDLVRDHEMEDDEVEIVNIRLLVNRLRHRTIGRASIA